MDHKPNVKPSIVAPIKNSVQLSKRILDLILIIPIIVVLSPIFFLLSLGYAISTIIFPDDRGPIFHRNFRKTKGRLFIVYKFRISRSKYLKTLTLPPETIRKIESLLNDEEIISLRTHPEYHVEDGGMVKTHFGSFLKQFYLDELPQLINILKGDMTFVGPRPFSLGDPRNLPDKAGRIHFADRQLDYSFKRELKSGLTGYYQLNKDSRAREDYSRFVLEGVKLDRRYYNEQTQTSCLGAVWLDLSILVRTIPVILRGEGI